MSIVIYYFFFLLLYDFVNFPFLLHKYGTLKKKNKK